MNKSDFLQQLEQELAGVSPDERVAALQYYNEYFDDAGIEQEDEVIQELDSPQKIAADIRAASDDEGWTPPEKSEPIVAVQPAVQQVAPAATNQSEQQSAPAPPFTQPLYSNAGAPPPYQQAPPSYAPAAPPYQNNNNRGVKILLLVLVIVFGLPIFGSLFGGFVGLAFSLLATAAIFLFLPFILGAGFTIAGVGLFVASFTLFPATFSNAVFLMGLSLLFTALGLGLCACGLWLVTKAVPPIFNGIIQAVRSVFVATRNLFRKLLS